MVEANSEEQRIQALFMPLIVDKVAWETSFTTEEASAGAAFEEQLRTDPAAAQEFQREIDTTFTAADVNGDALLDRDELKVFVTAMNANGVARGLKHRDTTDDFIDKVYTAFNGFNQATQGVSKMEILTILNMINAQTAPQ